MPAILHVLPARYPQAQFALPLPRRAWYAVEFRRHGDTLIPQERDGTLPAPAWQLTARYGRRRQAKAHAQLLARQYAGSYVVRIRKEVTP